jgi:hypothetical protein
MVDDFELGVEDEGTKVGGLAEVKSFRENDIVISEGKLDIVLADCEDVAEAGAVELLEDRTHTRQDLLEEVQRVNRHGRLSSNIIRQNIRFRNPSIY